MADNSVSIPSKVVFKYLIDLWICAPNLLHPSLQFRSLLHIHTLSHPQSHPYRSRTVDAIYGREFLLFITERILFKFSDLFKHLKDHIFLPIYLGETMAEKMKERNLFKLLDQFLPYLPTYNSSHLSNERQDGFQRSSSSERMNEVLRINDLASQILMEHSDDLISQGVIPPDQSSESGSPMVPYQHPLLQKIQALRSTIYPPYSPLPLPSYPQLIKFLRVILASQAAIDILSLAHVMKQAEGYPGKAHKQLKPRRTTREEVKSKIKKAQQQMLRVLREEPDDQKLVIKGRLRGRVKSNGTLFVGSQYRGVCRNGSNYQMFIMIDGQRKMYRGGFNTAREAGLAYDRAAIQLRGLRARTNLNYTKKEAMQILLGDGHVFDISRLEGEEPNLLIQEIN